MKNEPLDTEDISTDAVDAFTALFYSDRIFIGEHEYPVGQCMVDILNLEESELLQLDQSLLDVYHAIQSVWQEDTLESVERILTGHSHFSKMPTYWKHFGVGYVICPVKLEQKWKCVCVA